MDWREENKLKQKAQEYYEKEFSYNQVYIQGYLDGYNKAIDDFAEALKEEYVFDSICRDDVSKYEYKNKIDRIAEQLKAGNENE